MKKIKEIFKKNTKVLIAFILGVLITCTGVYAQAIINSGEVLYDNMTSGLTSTDVQGAIDELSQNAKDHCPDGYECTKIKLCKRATTLHTEICSQTSSSYCSGDGYTTGETITYGSTGTNRVLTTGDAFDCDVNGDGMYDEETERFYYISDLGTNSDYALLVYYNNVYGGISSDSTSLSSPYNSSSTWTNGPVDAIIQLPTINQWSNIKLTNTIRNLTDETGTIRVSEFSYEGYAARLLTYQEVENGCYDGTTLITSNKGLSSKCRFLMENTTYSNSQFEGSYWLETPSTTAYYRVWYVLGSAYVYDCNTCTSGIPPIVTLGKGVRPVIEVLKSEISY